MMRRLIQHRSVQSSACTAVILGASSTIGMPWALWVIWAALASIAVIQALRGDVNEGAEPSDK
ncbi:MULTISPECIES: hypothetical protein [unclassified Nocardioides]|uniref:hypothetical protein n=1 Tax=unclassified Nocardioides TaxID=2615069 RepID=UPI000703A587|nr:MULTISPECIES: hypothetical protein [unclassified Nocardioides]KRC48978.1 hypothetical protein ASE19_18950 [Nocardioides sp. Root79]KRC75379.1 hypothetical protein ASE20_20855 [Nocardioides sp. Root240]